MSEIQLDSIDKSILLALQGDLDDSSEPYATIASRIGATEPEVIRRILNLIEKGVIRRIGAMIRHIQAGIDYNAMVIWKIEPNRVNEVGQALAEFPEITHCYERPPFGKLGGTLFTMVHASSEADCMGIVQTIAEKIGAPEYEVLFSERELKKISMTYFSEENGAE